MTKQEIAECTHDYWLLCLQGRRRLNVYHLNREDLHKASLNHLTAQNLLDHLRNLPPALSHQIMESVDIWTVPKGLLTVGT
jgi:hypothetical protein